MSAILGHGMMHFPMLNVYGLEPPAYSFYICIHKSLTVGIGRHCFPLAFITSYFRAKDSHFKTIVLVKCEFLRLAWPTAPLILAVASIHTTLYGTNVSCSELSSC